MLAARMLARVAIKEGKFAQGMPEFGPERMGAPVCAYNRISDGHFSIYCHVVNPDIIIVLDYSLLNIANIQDGISRGGILIINTNRTPDEVLKHLHLTNHEKVYTVDASGISMATLGRNVPNMPMLGGIVKTTNLVTLQGLKDDIAQTFSEKFPPKIVDANLSALKRGHDEIQGESNGNEEA